MTARKYQSPASDHFQLSGESLLQATVHRTPQSWTIKISKCLENKIKQSIITVQEKNSHVPDLTYIPALSTVIHLAVKQRIDNNILIQNDNPRISLSISTQIPPWSTSQWSLPFWSYKSSPPVSLFYPPTTVLSVSCCPAYACVWLQFFSSNLEKSIFENNFFSFSISRISDSDRKLEPIPPVLWFERPDP